MAEELGKILVVMRSAGEKIVIIASPRYFRRTFGVNLYGPDGRLRPPKGWDVFEGQRAIEFTDRIAASTRRYDFEARIARERGSTN
jgi:hypothetical protein